MSKGEYNDHCPNKREEYERYINGCEEIILETELNGGECEIKNNIQNEREENDESYFFSPRHHCNGTKRYRYQDIEHTPNRSEYPRRRCPGWFDERSRIVVGSVHSMIMARKGEIPNDFLGVPYIPLTIHRYIVLMKILVVEDTLILAKNIVKYLSLQGIRAEFVRKGEMAIEKIGMEGFSLILLDLNLPGIDGLEVLSKIRKDFKNPVPIIILTSSATNEDVIQGLSLGADDYIAKPFDYKVLLARMDTVLRRSASNKVDTMEI